MEHQRAFRQVWWLLFAIMGPGKLRQEDYCEFTASISYRMSLYQKKEVTVSF